MKKQEKRTLPDYLLYGLRIIAIFSVIFMFVPGLNPARMSGLVNKTLSLFTSGYSYSKLTAEFARAVTKGWVTEGTLRILNLSSLGGCIGLAIIGAGMCMSLGEIKLKKLGVGIAILGSLVSAGSLSGLFSVYNAFCNSTNTDKVEPVFSTGLIIILAALAMIFLLSVIIFLLLPKAKKEDKFEMQAKYKLFLLLLPFIALTCVFMYLPLWGWRVTMFDYKAGYSLTADRFVGFKWFTYLFKNAATRQDIFRVMRNTLAMSGLGLATSWCAMAFAIFLSEIKVLRYRRVIQTLTTIPNFISWVLIYTFAIAIFSKEGFLNTVLIDAGVIDDGILFLQNSSHIWIKMLGWGMWKGLGWSAIIYIAAITGIDQQLFEAATVDGAGRFRRILHITIPSLLPTYFVLLLLSIAGILSNGMDQYYVFKNSMNKDTIEVLDLYVYTLGLGSGGASNIALATVIGMMKSIVSVTLLFLANRGSKLIRGETIV